MSAGQDRGMVVDANMPPIVPTDQAPTEGHLPVGRPVKYFAGDVISAIEDAYVQARDDQRVQLEVGAGSVVDLAGVSAEVDARLQVVPMPNLIGWAVRIVDIVEPVRASADADIPVPDSTGVRVPSGVHDPDIDVPGWGELAAGREWENAALTAVTAGADADLIVAASRDADTGEFAYVRLGHKAASDLAAQLQQALVEAGGEL